MKRELIKHPANFRITVRGNPIKDVRLKNFVDPGIEHSFYFVEWEAVVASGLDMWKWVNGEYPKWFMEEALAWYQSHKLVEAHSQDAAANATKK